MSGSFKKINYSLRAAKHAERRMLCEVARRLAHFDNLDQYRYIGFGSVWFTDFVAFHKLLGIRDMVSIESSMTKDRFMSNRPFNIDILFGKSSEVLPKIKFDARSIVWLDYDERIDASKLADTKYVVESVRSGSLIVISLQCNEAAEIKSDDENDGTSPIDRFTNAFTKGKVPPGLKEKDLIGWKFADVCMTMLQQEIDDALVFRSRSEQKSYKFHRICQFNYADDAKMTSLVGIVVNEDETGQYGRCEFDKLDFVSNGSDVVQIENPKLTALEFKRLEAQLPLAQGVQVDLAGGIPDREAREFIKHYRYYPSFAVLEH
ncbi:MAG: O-methyltransferase [Brucella sp.]